MLRGVRYVVEQWIRLDEWMDGDETVVLSIHHFSISHNDGYEKTKQGDWMWCTLAWRAKVGNHGIIAPVT
jgi:hypothetical protein